MTEPPKKEYPCNVVAYYTTRPIILKLGLPLYWNDVYTPHIPLIPLFLLWRLIGVTVIVLLGGLALLIGKSDNLVRVWFK